MNFEKYLTEASETDKDIREAFKNMDSRDFTRLRDAYYGVGDHISNLVREMNSFNGETGMLSKDLVNAKKSLQFFNNMILGKYI